MSVITPKRTMSKRNTHKHTFSQSDVDNFKKIFGKPKMPKLTLPKLPTIVVKFIISLLPDHKPELLLNLYKTFIYYEDANSTAEELYEAAYERAYYEDIQHYITYLAYPKLRSPLYFLNEPISKTLTDREVMYMVDLQLVHSFMNANSEDYLLDTIWEFSKCNYLMKLQPEFKWTNLSPDNLKYIYALEEALLTRSKGLLYWLEKNFPTYVAMSAIYIYFKREGFAPPRRINSACEAGFERAEPLADNFFLDFLIRVNTTGHSARPPKMLLRIAEEGINQLSLCITTKSSPTDDPIRIRPNIKLYNKLQELIQL